MTDKRIKTESKQGHHWVARLQGWTCRLCGKLVKYDTIESLKIKPDKWLEIRKDGVQ